MTDFLLGLVCLLVGMVALGSAGAMRRRQASGGWRLAIAGVGVLSAIAALVLIARAGGVGAVVFVSSALTLLIGVGAIVWFFVSVVNSAEEMLTPRQQSPQTPDFQFLKEGRLPQQAAVAKSPSASSNDSTRPGSESLRWSS